jgi:hypothetical protein
MPKNPTMRADILSFCPSISLEEVLDHLFQQTTFGLEFKKIVNKHNASVHDMQDQHKQRLVVLIKQMHSVCTTLHPKAIGNANQHKHCLQASSRIHKSITDCSSSTPGVM